MAKKTGRVILWGLVIGAAAAGTYHYLQNKGKAATADEFDDFDNLGDDVNGAQAKERNYIPLNLDNAKAFVSDTIDKAKEAVSRVSRKLQKEGAEDDMIIDDIFDDLDEQEADGEAGGDGAQANTESSGDAPAEPSSTTEDFFDDAQ